MTTPNYTTKFLCNGTDLGSIFVPNTLVNGSNSSFTGPWSDTAHTFTPTNTGYYLINFRVSYANNNSAQTTTIFGLTSTTAIQCQFMVSIGSQSGFQVNGPWINSAYIQLTSGTSYYFYTHILGSDSTAVTYNFLVNNISAVV
jgi:hypothetical protein